MKLQWTIFPICLILSYLFFFVPSVQAETMRGDAIFNNLVIEHKGLEHAAIEPEILFEGKSYVPLRVVANSLNKDIYVDKQTNEIVIKDSEKQEKIADNQLPHPSEFRPELKIDKQVSLSSSGAIILEDTERNIMFSKNAHTTFYPASTTKILTALVALEYGNLDDKVIVSEDVLNIPYDSSKAYIQPGDELTLEQLLYGLLLNSGNDCGVAIAVHIAGSEKEFAELMNEKAKQLGARNSHFINSHGYDHPNHYTTPYDLALILKAASDYPAFLEVLETPSYKAIYKDKNGETVTRYWSTTNQTFRNSTYQAEGIIGGKTGYTDLARHSLATVAERNGHRYFVVTLKGNRNGRYLDTKKLLQHAYQARDRYEQKSIQKIQVQFTNSKINIDGETFLASDQIFEYKGRTYIAQSYLKTLFVDVKKQQLNEKLVKLNVDSLLATDDEIKPLPLAFAKTNGKPAFQKELFASTVEQSGSTKKQSPFSFMIGLAMKDLFQFMHQ